MTFGLEPYAVDGVSLTPTLTWQPLPGAAHYEVELSDAQLGEPLIPPYRNLEEPRLTIEEPLEENTIYGWWLQAYAEDGSLIAYGQSAFSTSPAKARVPVELTSLGIRTVLLEDWQRVSPGVFEQLSEAGARRMLTFEKVAGDDPEAVLRARSTSSSGVIGPPFGSDTWWAQIGAGGDEPDHIQATARGGSVYLITVETEDEFPAELYGLVLPLVTENFDLTE